MMIHIPINNDAADVYRLLADTIQKANRIMENTKTLIMWNEAIGKVVRLYDGHYGVIKEIDHLKQQALVFSSVDQVIQVIDMKHLLPVSNGTFIEVDDDYLNIVAILEILKQDQ